MESKIFKKGELLTTSEGEYSDYCVNGLFEVTKEFEIKEAVDNYKELHVIIDDSWDSPKTKKGHPNFLGWLNQNGYVKDVEYTELHIGSYDRFTPSI